MVFERGIRAWCSSTKRENLNLISLILAQMTRMSLVVSPTDNCKKITSKSTLEYTLEHHPRRRTQIQDVETDPDYVVCSSCNPGTYSDTEDAMVCVECTEGFVQENYFQTQCEACPVNHAALSKGMTACEECPWVRVFFFSHFVLSFSFLQTTMTSQGKSTNEQTGSKDCSECSFFYNFSKHCDFPVLGVILGIILLFVFSYGVYFAYQRRKQYMKTKADLLAAKMNQRSILMRDRLRLKKMWIDTMENIGANITPYVRVELHASPHDKYVVLGT